MSYQSENTLKVAVLKGGVSSEREISLETGKSVANSLRNAGHEVIEIDLQSTDLPSECEKVDVVFPALHGEFGEDGKIQAILEEKGISFVGCDSKTSALIMQKQASKDCVAEAGIKVAKGKIYSDFDENFPEGFGLPLIVKPNAEGSTIGLTLVKEKSDWVAALRKALDCGEALVEEYISGIEITVGVVAGKALPVVEIIPPGELFDFDAKYAHVNGDTQYNCPPTKVSEDIQKEAQRQGEICFEVLGCRDMTRMDFIVTGEELCFLEGNSLPGFTASSLLPKSARQAGISFEELCDRLVQMAFDRSTC